MSLLPNGMPNDVPDAHAAPFTAAAVDWAAVASTLSDRAALLAAADAEAAAAAAVPLPGAGGGVPAPTSKPRAPRSVLASSASKELLEPSGCYKGVWRVVGGPREGLYKAQISVPGRAGRPKRLDYFRTDMDAAQCYDRWAQERERGSFAWQWGVAGSGPCWICGMVRAVFFWERGQRRYHMHALSAAG